ncbi:MAG TPA: FtsW/RodA/SpoVE family cell cycle protein, partial [Bacillota bacterium]|nr:FtsW/RodA/SpoVE family cell cycle protein [Bacillota bacterium]
VFSYVGMFAMTIFNYQNLKRFLSWAGYFVSLFLLVIVFAFPAKNGAHCWIILGGFQFQPSEFAKIFLILTISDVMERVTEKDETFGLRHIGILLAILCPPFILTLMQPHLGQALVMLGIVASMLVLFLEKKQLVVFMAIGAIFVSGIFMAKAIFPDQAIQYVDNLPFMNHQKERIITFIDPESDPKGTGYQVTQAMTAVGSGRLFGNGLLEGKQTQGAWVPEQWTDFIFSAIAEEFGFVGSGTLIFLFFFLLYRMIYIAINAPDYFSAYYIVGIVGMFAFQIIENVGMNLSMMPVTGITLPFVSYGGSSLLTNFILVGLVLSAGVRRKTYMF